ncbi:transmembrane protein 218 isoform X4 [Larus michahellis]|uniref:transmembrane protein 218 isoform X4 n=1 Tax=Larus michahellis TaxID=119627 RepID=UPI003D9AE25B
MPQHPGALTRSAKNVVGLPGVPCPEATTPCGRKILLNPSDRNPPCPKGCLHEIPRALGGGRPSCFQDSSRSVFVFSWLTQPPRRAAGAHGGAGGKSSGPFSGGGGTRRGIRRQPANLQAPSSSSGSAWRGPKAIAIQPPRTCGCRSPSCLSPPPCRSITSQGFTGS